MPSYTSNSQYSVQTAQNSLGSGVYRMLLGLHRLPQFHNINLNREERLNCTIGDMNNKDNILETTRHFLNGLPPGAEISIAVRFGAPPAESKKTTQKGEKQLFNEVFKRETNKSTKAKEQKETDSTVSVSSTSRKKNKRSKGGLRAARSVSSEDVVQGTFSSATEGSEYPETELLFPPAKLIRKENAEAFRARLKAEKGRQQLAKEVALTTESETEFSEKIREKMEKMRLDKKKNNKSASTNTTVTESTNFSDFCESTERLFPKCKYIRKEDAGKNYENIM